MKFPTSLEQSLEVSRITTIPIAILLNTFGIHCTESTATGVACRGGGGGASASSHPPLPKPTTRNLHDQTRLRQKDTTGTLNQHPSSQMVVTDTTGTQNQHPLSEKVWTRSPGSQGGQPVRTPSPSAVVVVQRLGPPIIRSLLPSPSVGIFSPHILHMSQANHNSFFFGVTGKLTSAMPVVKPTHNHQHKDNDGNIDEDAVVNPHDESEDNDEEEDDDNDDDDQQKTSGERRFPTGPPLTQIIDQFDQLEPCVVSDRPVIAMPTRPAPGHHPSRKNKLVVDDDEDDSFIPPPSTTKRPKVTDVTETGNTITIPSLPACTFLTHQYILFFISRLRGRSTSFSTFNF